MNVRSLDRILSVQSHVVHGFVGNKCASFILQTLGYDVDLINTVHFSNHTGYDSVAGTELKEGDIYQIYQSFHENCLSSYNGIITGYMKSAEVGIELAYYIKQMVPRSIYICDPVMGDNGKMYVPNCVLDVYKQHLLPLAEIVTPNFFEFKLLVEDKNSSYPLSIHSGLKDIHKMGPRHIAITSVEGLKDKHLVLYGSTCEASNYKNITTFKIYIPQLPATFTGTGDCFSAFLLHFVLLTKTNFRISCLAATVLLFQILKRTMELQGASGGVYVKELSLLESADLIRSFNLSKVANTAEELGIYID
ncbi:hypothetical protein GJ496_011658 [Pomphorhynchus laevis]|nr:hypothetical protein GJ496_011658 [Pomphorhynchus laevis]